MPLCNFLRLGHQVGVMDNRSSESPTSSWLAYEFPSLIEMFGSLSINDLSILVLFNKRIGLTDSWYENQVWLDKKSLIFRSPIKFKVL